MSTSTSTYDTSRLKDLAISESGFLFDPMSGSTFTASATAVCIIVALREGLRRPEIIARLRDQFATEDADADLESDLGDFLRVLVQQGILPQEFALDPAQTPPVPQGGNRGGNHRGNR